MFLNKGCVCVCVCLGAGTGGLQLLIVRHTHPQWHGNSVPSYSVLSYSTLKCNLLSKFPDLSLQHLERHKKKKKMSMVGNGLYTYQGKRQKKYGLSSLVPHLFTGSPSHKSFPPSNIPIFLLYIISFKSNLIKISRMPNWKKNSKKGRRNCKDQSRNK